jgi:hypothetical protein
MLKKLISVFFTMSVVVIIWPGASVQAACTWKKLSGGYCYYCPCTSYSSSGTAITPDQCIYWYPGSAFNRIILKFMPTDANKCEEGDCPTCVSAVFGTKDKFGNSVTDPLDSDAYIPMWVFCCPPGHTDPKTGECLDPVWSEGQPGFHQGYQANAAQIQDCNKRVCKEDVEVSFPPACPNENWYSESYPLDFNGLTCCCPLGFEETSSGNWECCYERDDNGICTSLDPGTEQLSIDEAALLLHCYKEGDPPYTFDEFDKCDNLADSGFSVPTGTCNWLYTEMMNSQ